MLELSPGRRIPCHRHSGRHSYQLQLQYVRDEIEDLYRIVAVVSLPQTAFTNTGAGVKSSVLFLKKYTGTETKKKPGHKTEDQRQHPEERKTGRKT